MVKPVFTTGNIHCITCFASVAREMSMQQTFNMQQKARQACNAHSGALNT